MVGISNFAAAAFWISLDMFDKNLLECVCDIKDSGLSKLVYLFFVFKSLSCIEVFTLKFHQILLVAYSVWNNIKHYRYSNIHLNAKFYKHRKYFSVVLFVYNWHMAYISLNKRFLSNQPLDTSRYMSFNTQSKCTHHLFIRNWYS